MRKQTISISAYLVIVVSLWTLPDPSQGQSNNDMPAGTTLPPLAPTTPYRCDICGMNGTIGNPVGMVQTQFGRLSCSALQGAAIAGAFAEDACGDVQILAEEPCDCEIEVSATSNPIPATTPVADPSEPADSEPFFCSICGEGKTVGNGGRLVQTPFGRSSCAVLAAASSLGGISKEDCPEIQSIVAAPCECTPGVSPTISPAAVPAPVAPTDPEFHCQICGTGMMVTVPDAVVTLSPQTERTCMQLLDTAAAGNIPQAQCRQLQQLTSPCGCEPVAPSVAPAPSVPRSSIPSDVPSFAPSMMPLEPGQTRAPNAAPVLTFDGCFEDLADIYVLERDLEDASIRRKYVLCPGSRFELGFVNDDGELFNGQPMIHLRPNVIYQCGDDGSRSNECILHGGDFGLASFYEIFEGISETVENVVIQGLTFQSQQLFSVVLEAAGDVTFTDCAFLNQENMAPIVIQWRGDGPPEELGTNGTRFLSETYENVLEQGEDSRKLEGEVLSHLVTFKDCVFRDNFASSSLAFPGIIENTFQSELRVINCLFENNDLNTANNPAPYGYAIRSFGPLSIESSCFIGNKFRSFGPVQAFGSIEASGNYGDSQETDLYCQFISVFESEDEFNEEAPRCIDFDASNCGLTQTSSPPAVEPTDTSQLDTENTSPTEEPAKGETSSPPVVEVSPSEATTSGRTSSAPPALLPSLLSSSSSLAVSFMAALLMC